MSNIYRELLDSELKEYMEKLPHYTLGQTLFSILTVATEGKFSKETLLSITDEDLYKSCRVSLKREIGKGSDEFSDEDLERYKKEEAANK